MCCLKERVWKCWAWATQNNSAGNIPTVKVLKNYLTYTGYLLNTFKNIKWQKNVFSKSLTLQIRTIALHDQYDLILSIKMPFSDIINSHCSKNIENIRTSMVNRNR